MKKWNGLALLLCLMLPLNAMAATEGVVEDAPMVEVEASVQAVSYLPDASYYDGAAYSVSWENADAWVENEKDEYGDYLETTQTPSLTAGEAQRAQKLLEDYKAGKVTYTGERVLEKMKNVIVGVYALNPAEFDGEAAYVILPGTCLTDDQLLSIIAAYDEIGLTFDPNGLNYRNCARGGGIETNRFFATEERERYNYLADCIRRGKLTPPEELRNLNEIIRNPQLQDKYFCGLGDFTLRPYRAMTDEELVTMLASYGVHDESGEIDHDAVERRARDAFYTQLGCPMSMELTGISLDGSYTPLLFTADGRSDYDYDNAKEAYSATFEYVNEKNIKVYASIFFDAETDEIVSLSTMHDKITSQSDDRNFVISEAVTQEKIDETIAELEARLNLPQFDWHTQWDHKVSTNWGLCITVSAQVDEHSMMSVYIGGDDGCEHGLNIHYGTLVETLP